MLLHEESHLNCERALLGCAILNPACFNTILEWVKSPDAFEDEFNATLFQSMQAVNSKFGLPDTTLVFEELSASQKNVGSMLARVTDSVQTSSNVEMYARRVFERYTTRRLIADASAISKSDGLSIDEIRARASKMVELASRRIEAERIESTEELAVESVARLEALADNNGIVGLKTGIKGYDAITGGLTPDMHVIAARPSVGKTALALNIARNVAVKEGRKVLFVSLEMSKAQLMDRLIMLEGGINQRRLREGFLGRAEKTKIRPAAATIALSPIEIVKKPSLTPSSLRFAIQSHNDAALVIVDYLQLMEVDERVSNRQEAVATISRSIKTLSGEFNVPIIALSQISREADEGAPKLKHLRESGAIEQDADTVLLLHPDKGTEKIVASLSKGRNCGTGIFDIAFNKDTQRMGDTEFGEDRAQPPHSENVYDDSDEEEAF